MDSETGHDAQSRNETAYHESNETPKHTPLPRFQLFIIFLIQFAEPVTATVIYPFVNQFVRETGVTEGDERKTGYYAGVIESVFFFAEASTALYWGRASDRFGRRPILLLGPLGLSLAMISFGLSNKFWSLVVSRCLQGTFNGNIGVSKSVMAEVTDASNIADAFALMPVVWSFGTTIGPVMGGILSRPATRWPETLGRIGLLRDYPYLLPCTVAALTSFVSGIIAVIGLKETLPSAIARNKRRKDEKSHTLGTPSALHESTTSLISTSHENYGSSGDGQLLANNCPPAEAGVLLNPSEHEPPPFRAFLVPHIIIPLLNLLLLTFTDMSNQVLQPLVYSTSVPLGGLGFEPHRIGMIMGIWGFLNAVIQVNLLGRLIRRFGPRTIHIVSYSCLFVVIGCYPALSFFARKAGKVDGKVWTVLVIQLTFQMMIYMAYGSIHIFIVDSAPNSASLGATNGLAQTLGSTTRSIAPFFTSSLFSVSLEHHLAGGNMVYLILLGITLVGIRVTLLLPKRLRSQGG